MEQSNPDENNGKLVRCKDGSWETDGDQWKLFPCWTCGEKYVSFDDREKCKNSHPPDMPQKFMKPLGLDNYEPVKEISFS